MQRNILMALGFLALASSVAPAIDDSGKGKGRHGRGGDRDERRIERRDDRDDDHDGDRERRRGRRAGRRRDNVALFRALDNNRDGLISRAEWRGSARSFDVLDRNDDGVISRGELGVRHR